MGLLNREKPQQMKVQTPPQTQPQVNPQPQMTQAQPVAPRQPPLWPYQQLKAQAAPPPVSRLVPNPLTENDKQSSVDIIGEAALHVPERQAHAEILDQVVAFCGMNKTGVKDVTIVLAMIYLPLSLVLTWHSHLSLRSQITTTIL